MTLEAYVDRFNTLVSAIKCEHTLFITGNSDKYSDTSK